MFVVLHRQQCQYYQFHVTRNHNKYRVPTATTVAGAVAPKFGLSCYDEILYKREVCYLGSGDVMLPMQLRPQ